MFKLKKLVTALAILFVMASNANAGERIYPSIERPIGTTALCMGENANGYNWENGKWVRAGFKPSKYTIKKVSIETKGSLTPPYNTCSSIFQETDFTGSDGEYTLYRCYIISEFGKEPEWREECNEYYHDNKLSSVTCDNFANIAFRPNGQFIRKSPYYDVRTQSETTEKSSMFIEHGECSDI
tara:strand:- start:96 stop:644 length:549 start_codon:yes stop_codon:yes gene_type:complete